MSAEEYVKQQTVLEAAEEARSGDNQVYASIPDNPISVLLAGFTTQDPHSAVTFSNIPDLSTLRDIQDQFNYIRKLLLIAQPIDLEGNMNATDVIKTQEDILLFNIKSTLGYKGSGVAAAITTRREVNLVEKKK